MTIEYGSGKIREGIILAQTGTTMRVALKESDDTMELRLMDGCWTLPEGEQVNVSYAPPAPAPAAPYCEEDFICPPQLAEHLIALLHSPESVNGRTTFSMGAGPGW
jgi:hypothetical protein